jgi:hypothetical protein
MGRTTFGLLCGAIAVSLAVAGCATGRDISDVVSPGSSDSTGEPTATVPTTATPTVVIEPSTTPSDATMTSTPSTNTTATESTSPDDTVSTPAADFSVTIVRTEVTGTSLAVAASVAGLVEDGGTCTLTATPANGSAKTATSDAFADAQSTVCGELDLTDLASGTWTLSVRYESTHHSATSDSTQIGVA